MSIGKMNSCDSVTKIRYQTACQARQKPVPVFWRIFGADFQQVCYAHYCVTKSTLLTTLSYHRPQFLTLCCKEVRVFWHIFYRACAN